MIDYRAYIIASNMSPRPSWGAKMSGGDLPSFDHKWIQEYPFMAWVVGLPTYKASDKQNEVSGEINVYQK